ncbi:precorrin-8X methylmutase [Prochlorococcus sp. AH-716-O13]|nr:precorrin-8X methylmutase [Prochlorococcus sp. AH-716-O13]
MIKDHPIFLESIRFIKSNLIENNFNYLENKVLERLVHTSGDFNIQKLLEFSEGACEKAVKSLKAGAPILTDTDMAASAIKSMAKNTNGNSVVSAKKWFNEKDLKGLTKTAYGIEKGWIELSAKNPGIQSPIVVIGSSPTALINLLKTVQNSQQIPSLIIGMPVGFIGVRQSKKKLLNTKYPKIVVNSTRGGAAMAAAAVNALLRETI